MNGSKPFTPVSVSVEPQGAIASSLDVENGDGLTVRQHIAIEAMKSIISSTVGVTNDGNLVGSMRPSDVAVRSIEYADALVEVL